MSGHLFIITAASGAGKTSLVKALLGLDNQVKLAVSYTTRKPRANEIDGIDYFFVDDATFNQRLAHGDFLEYAEVHGAKYATSQSQVEQALSHDFDIILEIDWQGAEQVRRIMPLATSIFVLPPSINALEQRLNTRGQDSSEVIARRIAAARDEMSHVSEFDYVTINDSFEVALGDIMAIIRSHRLTCSVQSERHAQLIKTLV